MTGPIGGPQLYQQRARAALPLLVRQAKAAKTIHYTDLAGELGMPNARNLNYVLGSVGVSLNRLSRQWKSKVPHIQALVVNQRSETPGEGFDDFLNGRRESWADDKERWAVLESYWARIAAYPYWDDVLRELELPPAPGIDTRPAAGLRGGGEGEDHRRLKAYVAAHPALVGLPARHEAGEVEHPLPSGDRVDVAFRSLQRLVCVEVKPSHSPSADIMHGLFQCVKYEAVAKARAAVEGTREQVSALLVLGGELPDELIALRNALGIAVVEGAAQRL